jgi:hypothetical protein
VKFWTSKLGQNFLSRTLFVYSRFSPVSSSRGRTKRVSFWCRLWSMASAATCGLRLLCQTCGMMLGGSQRYYKHTN